MLVHEVHFGASIVPLMQLCPLPQGGKGSGLTNEDVVHDAAKSARVKLEGSLNGEPFLVERSVTR